MKILIWYKLVQNFYLKKTSFKLDEMNLVAQLIIISLFFSFFLIWLIFFFFLVIQYTNVSKRNPITMLQHVKCLVLYLYTSKFPFLREVALENHVEPSNLTFGYKFHRNTFEKRKKKTTSVNAITEMLSHRSPWRVFLRRWIREPYESSDLESEIVSDCWCNRPKMRVFFFQSFFMSSFWFYLHFFYFLWSGFLEAIIL